MNNQTHKQHGSCVTVVTLGMSYIYYTSKVYYFSNYSYYLVESTPFFQEINSIQVLEVAAVIPTPLP